MSLEWRTIRVLKEQPVQAEISVAEGRRGRLYSYSLSRIHGYLQSKFFRPGDGAALIALLARVDRFIAEDRCDHEEKSTPSN